MSFTGPSLKGRGIFHAAGREPAEMNGKQPNQHQANPEERRRISDDGAQIIRCRASHEPACRDNSEQAADTTEIASVVPIKRSVGPRRCKIGLETDAAHFRNNSRGPASECSMCNRTQSGCWGQNAPQCIDVFRRRRPALPANTRRVPGASCSNKKLIIMIARMIGMA